MGWKRRLFSRKTVISTFPDITDSLYGSKNSFGRHLHRFEVNLYVVDQLEGKDGMVFIMEDERTMRMVILERFYNSFFFGTQFQPDLTSCFTDFTCLPLARHWTPVLIHHYCESGFDKSFPMIMTKSCPPFLVR